MSRQRTCLVADHRRLRSEISLFQASDSEIQADLKKLKYVKKPEPESVPVEIKTEIPKKRKPPVEDDTFAVEMLAKLQNSEVKKVQEAKKKPVKIEKKPEVAVNKQPLISQHLMNLFAIQQQFNSLFMNNNFMISRFPISSSADKHLRIANFIQDHKNKSKLNCFK